MRLFFKQAAADSTDKDFITKVSCSLDTWLEYKKNHTWQFGTATNPQQNAENLKVSLVGLDKWETLPCFSDRNSLHF